MIRENKLWFLKSVILLSLNGGLVSSITFESFLHNPVGYVTGNITFASLYFIQGQYHLFFDTVFSVISFFIGAALSGIVIQYNNYKHNLRYNFIWIIESVLIFVGMLGLLHDMTYSRYLLALSLGLQNATTTYYGSPMLRTTHMTGTMTDLGLITAQKLIKHHDIPSWKLITLLMLIVAFFWGSVLGIYLFEHIGFYGLIIPIIICLLMIKINIKLKLPNLDYLKHRFHH